MATITSLRFPVAFDTEKLKFDLRKVLSAGWTTHYNTDAFSGDWSSVALMSEGGRSSNINATPTGRETVRETELLEICPYFREVLSYFECRKTSARLLRLGAGAEIKPHRDYCLGYEDGVFRIHVPVVTNEKVVFILAGERIVMEEGSCWYIDANEEHSVKNCGKVDRIHLVIDCERNAWTDALFFGEAPETQFNTDRTPHYSPDDLTLMIAELERMKNPAVKALIDELKRKTFS